MPKIHRMVSVDAIVHNILVPPRKVTFVASRVLEGRRRALAIPIDFANPHRDILVDMIGHFCFSCL